MKLKIVNEPYPFDNSLKKDGISAFAFGLFIFLFLLVFQPFGLSNYKADSKILDLAGYGLVTTVVLFAICRLSTVLFSNWYSKQTWTVGKNIFFTIIF